MRLACGYPVVDGVLLVSGWFGEGSGASAGEFERFDVVFRLTSFEIYRQIGGGSWSSEDRAHVSRACVTRLLSEGVTNV